MFVLCWLNKSGEWTEPLIGCGEGLINCGIASKVFLCMGGILAMAAKIINFEFPVG